MLLGCCHCGQTPPSDSVPPSASQSLPPSTSDVDVSIFGNLCGYCSVFPRSFSVPISNSMFTFNSRGGTRRNCAEFSTVDIHYVGTTRSLPLQGYPDALAPCAVWASGERAKNTNLAALCADYTSNPALSTPRVEMFARPSSAAVVFTLLAWHWGGSIFGSPAAIANVWRYTHNPPSSGSNCVLSYSLGWYQVHDPQSVGPTYTSSIALAPTLGISPS